MGFQRVLLESGREWEWTWPRKRRSFRRNPVKWSLQKNDLLTPRRRLQQAAHQPTINGNGRAIDVAGALGAEEGHDRREFFRRAQAPERNLRSPTIENVLRRNAAGASQGFGELIQPFGARITRADVVHGDVVGAELIGQGARQSGDSGTDGV